MMRKKSLEELRQSLGVTPPSGRAKGVPTYLFHLAFRMNEDEARDFIQAASAVGTSESIWARQAILEKLKKEE